MFHGSIVALVTPMRRNGEIDFDGLRQLAEMHVECKTDAIVVAGTTGEAATLTEKERIDVISAVVKQINGRIPVIAGTGEPSTQATIETTQRAVEQGVDACLILSPAYIRPTQEGIYEHYKQIATQVPIPLIVYNVPKRTGSDVLPETMARLSKIPNIVGIKEATGSRQRYQDLLEACGGDTDIYSGDDATNLELLNMGGQGAISVVSNVAPKEMSELCQAMRAKDMPLASAIDKRLQALYSALFVESNPIPVKWALNRKGWIAEGIRLPLTPLSYGNQDVVYQAMLQAGIVS